LCTNWTAEFIKESSQAFVKISFVKITLIKEQTDKRSCVVPEYESSQTLSGFISSIIYNRLFTILILFLLCISHTQIFHERSFSRFKAINRLFEFMSDYGNGTSTSNKYNSWHDPAFPHCIILYLRIFTLFLRDIFPCVILFHLERHTINVIHSNLVELSENGKRTSNKYYTSEILCGQQLEIDSTTRFHGAYYREFPS